LQIIQRHLPNIKAILFSDYQNGLLSNSMVQLVKQLGSGRVPLVVDTQGALEKYQGFDVVKCNADDASEYLNRRLQSDDDFEEAALTLAENLSVKQAMVITRGGDGATIAEEGHVSHSAAPHVSDVYDTVGAGDTWIAVLTLAIVAGTSVEEAAMLANVASGVVVQHVGNYTPTADDLLNALG
jgi:rfaE bifunctional protein kinase chain/domain